MEFCVVTFNIRKDLKNSIMVQKKTKKLNKIFFIPKSLILEEKRYELKKNLWKDISYIKKRIALKLPKWYCEKELKFFK